MMCCRGSRTDGFSYRGIEIWGIRMPIDELLNAVEMDLIEARGQLIENGTDHFYFKEAVRQLQADVEMLSEKVEGEN